MIVFGTGIAYLLRMMATAPEPGEPLPREDVTASTMCATAWCLKRLCRRLSSMDTLFGGPILPVIFGGVIAFAFLAYVVCDGFDLGVGVFFVLERQRNDRDVMINTIAPVWDGNETWLVLGGAGLYGAFPAAYSTVLPALSPLFILMLLGLIFRGELEFRFRAQSESHRNLWDTGFLGGSIVAAFCQGMMAGGLIQGIKIADGKFVGGPFDFLTPLAIFCGVRGDRRDMPCWGSPGCIGAPAGALGNGACAGARRARVAQWSSPSGWRRVSAAGQPGVFPSLGGWLEHRCRRRFAPIALLLLGQGGIHHLGSGTPGTHDAVPFLCELSGVRCVLPGSATHSCPMIVPAG